jgi:hypothetical protein
VVQLVCDSLADFSLFELVVPWHLLKETRLNGSQSPTGRITKPNAIEMVGRFHQRIGYWK